MAIGHDDDDDDDDDDEDDDDDDDGDDHKKQIMRGTSRRPSNRLRPHKKPSRIVSMERNSRPIN